MQSDTASLNGLIGELLVIGRQMLVEAQAGDWVRAGELQAGCHALAATVFAKPLSSATAATVADAIKTVLGQHDEVMSLCRESRDAYQKELDNLNQGRQAITEYSANSG